MRITLFYDEAEAGTHRWPFAYLHGKAEDVAQSKASEDGEQVIPDIFISDTPMPGEGNHLAYLYGEPVLAVIRQRHGILAGRVALLSDTEALKHALDVFSWR